MFRVGQASLLRLQCSQLVCPVMYAPRSEAFGAFSFKNYYNTVFVINESLHLGMSIFVVPLYPAQRDLFNE